MAEFNTNKGTDDLTDRTLIIDKDGSLKTPNEYGQISPDPNSYKLGNPPYFLRVSIISEIAYCSEGFSTLKTYKMWRNMLRKAGYAEILLSESSRLLAIQKLETIDRYFWNMAIETSSRNKISVRNAMGKCLHGPSLMVELLSKTVSVSHPGPSGSGGPRIKDKEATQNLSMAPRKSPENPNWKLILSVGDFP